MSKSVEQLNLVGLPLVKGTDSAMCLTSCFCKEGRGWLFQGGVCVCEGEGYVRHGCNRETTCLTRGEAVDA